MLTNFIYQFNITISKDRFSVSYIFGIELVGAKPIWEYWSSAHRRETNEIEIATLVIVPLNQFLEAEWLNLNLFGKY